MMTMNVENRVRALEAQFGRKMLNKTDVAEYLGVTVEDVTTLVKDGFLTGAGGCMFSTLEVASFELGLNSYYGGGIMKISKGSIYKTHNKKNPLEMCFIVTLDSGERRPIKVRGTSESELFKKKEERIKELQCADIVSEKPVTIQPMTFGEVADQWFKERIEKKIKYNGKGTSYSNIKCIKDSINALKKEIGNADIRTVDTVMGNDILDRLSYKDNGVARSMSYINKIRNNFVSIMKFAREKRYTDEIIGEMILNKDLRKPNAEDKVFDIETLSKIFKVIEKNDRYNALVHLLVGSGTRQEEALAVYIDDFKEDNGRYYVHINKSVVEVSKNKYDIVWTLKQEEPPRPVPIPKKVYDMVVGYYENTLHDKALQEKKAVNGYDRLVFVDRDGKPMNKCTLYHNYNGFMSRNFDGWKRCGLHCYRHTYASLMTESINIETVSEIMGHSDTSVTSKNYVSMTKGKSDMAGAAISNLFEKLK